MTEPSCSVFNGTSTLTLGDFAACACCCSSVIETVVTATVPDSASAATIAIIRIGLAIKQKVWFKLGFELICSNCFVLQL